MEDQGDRSDYYVVKVIGDTVTSDLNGWYYHYLNGVKDGMPKYSKVGNICLDGKAPKCSTDAEDTPHLQYSTQRGTYVLVHRSETLYVAPRPGEYLQGEWKNQIDGTRKCHVRPASHDEWQAGLQRAKDLLEVRAMTWTRVGYTRRLAVLQPLRRMKLSDMWHSEKMMGVSLRMGMLNIQEVLRGSTSLEANGHLMLLPDDKLLCFLATDPLQVQIQIQDHMLSDLLKDDSFVRDANHGVIFGRDLQWCQVPLCNASFDNDYTILKGSRVIKVGCYNGEQIDLTAHPKLWSSACIKANNCFTVRYDPTDRVKKHFSISDEEAPFALFNRVKLNVGPPLRVGPSIDGVDGLDLKGRTGLALGFQVNENRQVCKTPAGPATLVTDTESEFLIYCGAVDKSCVSLLSTCKGTSMVMDNQQWLVILEIVGPWMDPDLPAPYAPCLTKLAVHDQQELVHSLSEIQHQPLAPQSDPAKRSEALDHAISGLSREESMQLLLNKVMELSRASPGVDLTRVASGVPGLANLMPMPPTHLNMQGIASSSVGGASSSGS